MSDLHDKIKTLFDYPKNVTDSDYDEIIALEHDQYHSIAAIVAYAYDQGRKDERNKALDKVVIAINQLPDPFDYDDAIKAIEALK